VRDSIGDDTQDWLAYPDAITGRGMVLFDEGRVRAAMDHEGIDLLLPHTVLNAGYLSDYYYYDFPPFYATESGLPYLGFVGFPGDPRLEPFMVGHTGGNAMDIGDQDPWIKDRYLFGPADHHEIRDAPARSSRPVSTTALDAAAMGVMDRELSGARIGVELAFLGARVLQMLQASLPGAAFVDAGPILDHSRIVKTPEELRRLTRAAEGSRLIHEAVTDALREGMSGYELDRTIKRAAAEHNRDIEFREIHPNASGVLRFCPSPLTVVAGESIVVDVGTRYLGYVSDMAHNHSLGPPASAVADLHARVSQVFGEVVERLRPGVSCAEVASHGLRRLKELDVPMAYQLVGHGIGRGVHEGPVLSEHDTRILEEDMVVSAEIPIFIPGVTAVQIEENYVITTDGARCLAPSPLGVRVKALTQSAP
jgi:Xaa-Pro aminopeptidase